MRNKQGDYIPKKDKDLVVFGKNFKTVVADNSTKWSITEGENKLLSDAVTDFESSVNKAYGPDRTKSITVHKNEARKELEKQIRGLVNFRLKNPVVTNQDRVELGLPLRDNTRSKIDIPTDKPTVNIKVLSEGQLSVRFHENKPENRGDNASRAIPYGMDGAVIIYEVLPEPPTEYKQLTRHHLATRSPYLMNFSLQERGKTAYFAVCWQNEKGQRGPFSPIISAIIP
ncbi:MAG: hypothetical protein LBF79_01810 [Dysgonamonadaceae bacterium]|jgi:hypothetical protein|nr:hypothetical protein [Dysgonamonadaceae bacterium]